MRRLKFHADQEPPESLPFPGVRSQRPVRETRSTEQPTPDAIRMVEDAMRDAQRKFDRLREMLGYGDTDRPRAA